MEWWDVLVAILFVIGVSAYPGWNLILRLELSNKHWIKILSKPSKSKILSKPSKSKILSKPSKHVIELEKIFGI